MAWSLCPVCGHPDTRTAEGAGTPERSHEECNKKLAAGWKPKCAKCNDRGFVQKGWKRQRCECWVPPVYERHIDGSEDAMLDSKDAKYNPTRY